MNYLHNAVHRLCADLVGWVIRWYSGWNSYLKHATGQSLCHLGLGCGQRGSWTSSTQAFHRLKRTPTTKRIISAHHSLWFPLGLLIVEESQFAGFQLGRDTSNAWGSCGERELGIHPNGRGRQGRTDYTIHQLPIYTPAAPILPVFSCVLLYHAKVRDDHCPFSTANT